MRHRLVLAGLVTLLVLAVATVAGARVKVSLVGGTLKIEGTGGNDRVTIENIPGIANPMQRFYAISDPGGVKRLPPGCFRFNAKEIHCPVELVREFEVDLGAGDDELNIGENVVDELEVDGEGGDDELEGGEDGDDLDGGPGRDVERGGPGGDRLFGGAGGDRLFGQGGRDNLLGGGGRDRCNGGAGNDAQRSCEIGANY